MSRLTATDDVPDLEYPSTDGKPMGESGWHIQAVILLNQGLRQHLADRLDAYVGTNMFLYYEQGNPKKNKAPDCMVIFGAGNHERRTFKTWSEGVVPSVIFEIASKETYREDLNEKRDLYASLGVGEYFLFDPLEDCLDTPLIGFRLEGSSYVPMPREADGGLTSRVLGLRLVPEGFMIRLIDQRTNRPILTDAEKAETIERLEPEALRTARLADEVALERQRAARERQRADAFEREVERLRALLGDRRDPDVGEHPDA